MQLPSSVHDGYLTVTLRSVHDALVMKADYGWTRLAAAVQARRNELMLSQAELAAKAGISESTVRSIENERRDGYRFSTLRDLSTALGWTPLSVDRVLAGGDPEPVDEPKSEDADLRSEVQALREELAALRTVILDFTSKRD